MTYEPSAATAKRFAWAVTFCYAFRCLPSTRTAVLLRVDFKPSRTEAAPYPGVLAAGKLCGWATFLVVD
jgi:hypothetical protein